MKPGHEAGEGFVGVAAAGGGGTVGAAAVAGFITGSGVSLIAVHFATCALQHQGHSFSDGLVAHIPDINPVVDDCITFVENFRSELGDGRRGCWRRGSGPRGNLFGIHKNKLLQSSLLEILPHITTTPFSCNWVSLFTPQNQFLCPPIVCYGWPPFFQVVGIAQKVGPMFWPFMATEKCNLLGWQLSTVVIYKIS
ncbi:hypothetical protein JHK87_056992 [Glycine soja]|nr:hypothetical protein JHK87_056992 [Glycine soja]